jgi:hypothetical protein
MLNSRLHGAKRAAANGDARDCTTGTNDTDMRFPDDAQPAAQRAAQLARTLLP